METTGKVADRINTVRTATMSFLLNEIFLRKDGIDLRLS